MKSAYCLKLLNTVHKLAHFVEQQLVKMQS